MEMTKAMKGMRLICVMAAMAWIGGVAAHAVPESPWDQPAAALTAQIAEILGPGQARLTIRNQSSIAVDEVPAIRRLLEQDLKAHSVTASGAESANAIRITLSENARERLWVAEVVEGSEMHVTMVHVERGAPITAHVNSGLVLRKQPVLATPSPVLALLETQGALVAIEPEEIVIYRRSGDGWQEQKRATTGQKRGLTRDPRAVILPAPSGDGFDAMIAGVACTGTLTGSDPAIRCHESDDPWPLVAAAAPSANDAAGGLGQIKAFYNAARDYFTGVVTPGIGVDLPPFYSAALLPRPAGAALLLGGIDGKVQMAEGGSLKPVSGTRDWGSDFAVVNSGCGAGSEVTASGSGEALSDSLRAYELPALEAVPASAPLAMEGTVTALWSAPDGKSAMAVVRHAAGDYEVDRVTALCD
jgi:hypothetical protein